MSVLYYQNPLTEKRYSISECIYTHWAFNHSLTSHPILHSSPVVFLQLLPLHFFFFCIQVCSYQSQCIHICLFLFIYLSLLSIWISIIISSHRSVFLSMSFFYLSHFVSIYLFYCHSFTLIILLFPFTISSRDSPPSCDFD